MIQSTGTIIGQDGISKYTDLVINVYFASPSKYTPSIGVAQVGIFTEATESEPANFNAIAKLGVYTYEGVDPSFTEVQNAVLAGLQADYPNVTFEII